MLYLDTSTATKWLYVSEHGDVPAVGQTTAPSNGGRILRFNATTGSTTPQVVATRGTGAGQFISPDGLTMTASGTLLVADRHLNKVEELSIDATTGAGTRVRFFGSGTAGGGAPGAGDLRGPLGLSRDSAGAVYVSEHGWGNPGDNGNVVSKWTLVAGAWVRQWRVSAGGFSTPYGVAVNGSELYVSDGFNNRVQTLSTADGSTVRAAWSVGSGIIPLGLSFDTASLWVAEATGNSGGTQRAVRRNPTTGAIEATVGSAGSGNMQFALPFHAVRDAATNLIYIADYNNNRVQVIDLTAPVGDTTPPTVAVTGGSGSTSPATFTVTFSETVTGVDAADFTATFSGSVAANGSLSVTGSGPYTVSVPFTATGSGTVTLALNGNATSTIRDSANNPYAGGATSGGSNTATFSVTSTPPPGPIVLGPTITTMALANATSTNGNYTVTFSESVTGVTGDDFLGNGVAGTQAQITGATGSGANWVVAFNYQGNAGSLQIGARTSGTNIVASGSGAAYVGVGRTASNPEANLSAPGDMTPPSATISAGTPTSTSVTFTVTFSETVIGVAQSDFTVLRSSGVTAASVQPISSTGNVYTVPVNFTGTGNIQLLLPGGATSQIADTTGHWMTQSAISSSVAVSGGSGPTVPEIDVTGNGVAIADGDTTPTTTDHTDFGSVATTGGTFTRTFTIANSGSASLTGVAATISGTNAADFSVTTAAGTTVAAGANTTFVVTFNPSADGARNATVSIASNDADENPYTFAITGTGTTGTTTAPEINVTGNGATIADGDTTPSTADDTDFGSMVVAGAGTSGGASITKTYTIRNTGTAALTIGEILALTSEGQPHLSFVVTQPATTSVAAGGTTTFNVTFTAGSATVHTATINVPNNDSDENPYNFAVRGTGTSSGTPAPEIGLTGNGVAIADGDTTPSTADHTDFGGVLVSSGTISRTFTIQNTGTASLTGVAATISGTNAADFAVTTAPSATVAASGTTTVIVRFDPSAAGARNATISIASNDADENPYTFAVTGTGTLPDTTAPTVASLNADTPTSSSVNFTLTLSEQVNGVNAGASGDFTVVTSSGVSATIGSATPASGPAQAWIIPVTFTGAAGGTVRLNLNASGHGITDVAGNALVGGFTGAQITIPAPPQQPPSQPPPQQPPVFFPPIFTPPPPAAQTIDFNSPVSAIVINTPILLNATTSSGLPVTFAVVSGSASLSGNTLTPKSTARLVVRASQAGNSSYAAASKEVDFGNPQKASQSINLANLVDLPASASPVAVTATATSGLPVNLSVTGAARLVGNTIVPNGAAGIVTVRASQGGNDMFNPAAEVTRTFNVRAVGQQVYIGTMGADQFAIVLSQDNTKGVFVTRLDSTGEAIVGKFTVNADGTFRVNATSSLTISEANPATPAVAALVAPRTISGTVNNGVVTGSIAELGSNFTANVSPATGSTASLAGVYIASIPGSASGETYIVAGPNGTAYAVAVTPMGVTSGTGTISADGAININTSGGGSIVGNVDAGTGMINGTFRTENRTAALVGLSEGATRSDRLVNLSSRVRVVAGDASRTVVAGFVIAGTENKEVLIRAVGPSLSGFGVTDALANPRLQLYNSAGVLVSENDDWNNNNDVSTVGDRVGAFKLPTSSRDSAINANLAPGAYTAVVSGVNSSGVALVEVYDAASNAPINASQQLVNISTRGFVDTGDGNLIAGFVVTGNAPKRVLIRGIGPSLTQFGVNGAVTDPMLRVYAAGSSTVIAQNNDWSTPQAVDSTQSMATAADIAAASTATGAFPLAANSRDAAIVVTLMPGQYSAVVSGANNSTGAGLVEVYELSNH